MKTNQQLAKITKEIFLKDYNIRQVQITCNKIDSISDVLKSSLPTIGKIRQTFGNDFIQAYIEGWIVNLRDFVNVSNPMTDEQTFETAMLIVQEFYTLTIADVNYIFKQAKMGRYGSLYGRLDGQLIMSWFDDHFNKRCVQAADNSVLEADSFKDNYPRSSKILKFNKIIK